MPSNRKSRTHETILIDNTITRRDFLKAASITAGAMVFGPKVVFGTEPVTEVSVVRGGEATAAVHRAVELLGGMTRYVAQGDIVVVKPNIGWDTHIGDGADTNPDVVGEIIKMCFEAGAKKVKVFDNTCNQARRCYLSSGIEKTAKDMGADVTFVNENRFEMVELPEGVRLKAWPVYRDALPENRDVLINVPVLKQHSLPRAQNGNPGLSIGFKNLMGVMGGNRGDIHNHFEEKIVDFGSVIRPDLTIVDATSVLLRNGPRGGRLADIAKKETIIAGSNMVSVDAWGVRVFGYPPEDLDYLVEAHRRGLGEIDLSKVVTKEERLD
jgi:uncharacterized protein (DUF362 family)